MTRARNRLLGARRIAVLRTDRLGDLVLTLPMFAALRSHCPNASLHLVCRAYAAPAATGIASIDRTHLVDREPAGLPGILAREGFDAAFFPWARPAQAWDAARARIPLRVGNGYRWYSFLYTHRVYDHRSEARFHEAEYNTRLISSVLGHPVETTLQRPSIDPGAREQVNRLLADLGIRRDDPLLVLHPGTGGSTREWPPERFGEVGAALAAAPGLRAVITGLKAETAACDGALRAYPEALSLCGALSLEEMMALLERATLLVVNATGVLHLAAAIGTPVVGLYPNSRPVSPARWRPWSDRGMAISPPNGSDDMEAISVAVVLASARELLREAARAPATRTPPGHPPAESGRPPRC